MNALQLLAQLSLEKQTIPSWWLELALLVLLPQSHYRRYSHSADQRCLALLTSTFITPTICKILIASSLSHHPLKLVVHVLTPTSYQIGFGSLQCLLMQLWNVWHCNRAQLMRHPCLLAVEEAVSLPSLRWPYHPGGLAGNCDGEQPRCAQGGQCHSSVDQCILRTGCPGGGPATA